MLFSRMVLLAGIILLEAGLAGSARASNGGLPLPDKVPATIEPGATDFNARVGDTDSRTYEVAFGGVVQLTLDQIAVESATAEWSYEGPRKLILDVRRPTVQFTIKFIPKKEGPSSAQLKFSARHKKSPSDVDTERVSISLSGTGLAPPGGAPAGGGTTPGPSAPPPGGAPAGGDAGVDNEPGTPPPATDPADVAEVCLKFWRLPGATVSEDDTRSWVDEANRVFRGSGVRFVIRGALEDSRDILERGDAHCLDVYVGARGSLGGRLLGRTGTVPAGSSPDEPSFEERLRDLGAHEDYVKRARIGGPGSRSRTAATLPVAPWPTSSVTPWGWGPTHAKIGRRTSRPSTWTPRQAVRSGIPRG